jgi:tRNA threonylcarbamoyladenosine biosynthesis protein TsaE
MATFISHSPAETEALGEAWGREARRGIVIALSGDLGAGKTQLVRGLARGLGCAARVHSPTFTLVNVYSGGRLTLFHLDLYRLETAEQIHGAGVDEYLQPDGVAVIEWAERMIGEKQKAESGETSNIQHSTFNIQLRGIASRNSTPNGQSNVRRVNIEVVDETTRRIVYEDSGA